MKISIEIECTPEEARKAAGLPDLSHIHERYTSMVMETMQGTAQPEMLETMMRHWAPMGESGMTLWRSLFETAPKTDR